MSRLMAGGSARRFPAARILLLVLSAAVVFVWIGAFHALQQGLVVTFLDVGEGDCLLLQSPAGRAILVDGGGRPDNPQAGEVLAARTILPALLVRGVRRLDAVVITHPHDDHIGGLPAVIRELPVGMILAPHVEGHEISPDYHHVLDLARERRIPVHLAAPGQSFHLGQGIVGTVLYAGSGFEAENLNDVSVVLRLVFGEFSALLPGDLEADGETRLLARRVYLHSTVLKVGHHGSPTSSSEAFVRTVRPELAVISVGSNPYGHPNPGVVARFRAAGTRVLRTDQNGAITLHVDGRRWHVETFR